MYKSRAQEVLLDLSPSDSDDLWLDMRGILFPTVADNQMTQRQIADVHQVFLHTLSSGSTASNSVFVTLDNNFIDHAEIFQNKYGVLIMPPNLAWSAYQPQHQLTVPSRSQANDLWRRQREFIARIEDASS